MSNRRSSPLNIEKIESHDCSLDLRLEVLRQVPFFRDMDNDTLQEINRIFREYGFDDGETIYFTGDQATHMHVLAAGKIKLMHHSRSGQEILVDILKPGEFFGSLSALNEGEYSETAVAYTQTCVLSICSDDFRSLLKNHPSVALSVLDIVTEKLRESHEMIHRLSAHSVEKRIAYILIKLAKKLGESKEVGLLIQLPLSRTDLAEMAGTTPETASRIMSRFQKSGLVRTGRQWIAVSDLKRLTAFASS